MAQFTNQAALTYNGGTVSSNIVTGELTQVVTVTKAVTAGPYRPGDVLTYVVTLRNAGTTALSGLTVTDDLGQYAFNATNLTPLTFTGDAVLYYLNGAPQTAPAVTAGPPLTVTGVSIPAGGDAVLVYRARVNEYAPLGTDGAVNNTVTITGDGLAEAATAAAAVTAADTPQLTILKALNPTTVVENGQITYTFTIENTGPAAVDADAALTLTDTFTPALAAPLTVTLNGETWPQTGNYTYNAATGQFATVAGRLTVPAAAYTQDASTGAWRVTPGVTTVTVTGTI